MDERLGKSDWYENARQHPGADFADSTGARPLNGASESAQQMLAERREKENEKRHNHATSSTTTEKSSLQRHYSLLHGTNAQRNPGSGSSAVASGFIQATP